MLINSTYKCYGNTFPLCVDVTVACSRTLRLSRRTVVVLQCSIYEEYCKDIKSSYLYSYLCVRMNSCIRPLY